MDLCILQTYPKSQTLLEQVLENQVKSPKNVSYWEYYIPEKTGIA